MGHYTGPKARINRRLGFTVFENSGARRAFERRENPPGMHGMKRTKRTAYAEALTEKQKIKYYYGLGERQLARLFDMASRAMGNTGTNLLMLCERRLDNVVRRAGLALTRPQARQGIAHGHFLVNGKKCDIPSYLVRVGDVIHVRNKVAVRVLYTRVVEQQGSPVPDWLGCDTNLFEIKVRRLPDVDDISLRVNVGSVVELLTR